ncbi:Hypothetical Protein FCC1311_029182 [Hondaea fermentalgiana]|uniref:Uncharacterized protein n=1 Tax=Hondaea fermentalgiana TaxID=2315210 RepID=A0A2R5G6L6_9STRA|nr:Hypothetical Protein FCC1311_029182 [Hondaea fermentalgiana]|eukprot:GBG26697.1 Hypothetical Protein FCC1311_029182 [Hondaea fermentalgiana]
MEAWLASFPFKSAANRKRTADENGEIHGISENAVLAVATQILGRKCQDLEDQVIPLAEQLLRVPQGTLARHERSHKSLEEHATQVLLGCAVECRDRDLYIASILKLDAAAQITLKAEIEDLFELIRSRVSSNGSGAVDAEGQDENDTPNEEGVVDHEIEAHDQGIAPQFDDEENEVLEEEEEEEEIGDGAADTTPSRKSPRGTHFTIHASLADASVDSTGGLADEVEQLKARVHELTQEKLVLEQNTIEQDGVCEDLRTQMSVLQTRLEDDRASAAAENLAMSSRGGDTFDAEAQVLELQEALEAARLRESELDTALRARQQAQSTINELNQRISAYEKEMQGASQLKDSLQRSELAVERLVNDLQAYKSTVKELREERDSLRDRIREVPSSAGSSLNLSSRSLGSASASPSVSASASASASPGSGRRQTQQELDVARQSSEAEIKEWADYAHSLEGDRAKKEALVVKLRETSTALEVLNTNYIELQKDMGESKREIDFWSQKVQDLHHDFTIVRKERDVLADHLGCAMETQRMQLEDHEATMRQRSGADAMRRRLTREFNAKLTDLMRKMARLQSEIEVEREARRMACARYEKLVEEVPRQVAAQVQERVGALQDAEEPGLRKLVQLFSSADSPAVRGQSRVRRNLDAMVKDLISTPRGKDAEASTEVRGTTGREVERDVAQLRDVNERLGRENEWLREQFEARGAPPSPSIDFDSAEGGSDSLVVAGRGARAGGASGVARHLRQALVELQRENAALRKANVAEIEERARMQGELHSLRKELDRLRLKSIHASTKMIREKRVPAEAVTLWFNAELERVSVKAEELATSSMSFVAPGSPEASAASLEMQTQMQEQQQ